MRPWFCPGYGDALSHRVAKAIGRARRRVRICSPVISAGPVLGTLAEVAAEGRVDVAGCVDATQLAYVHEQWTAMKVSAWKIPLLEKILDCAPFSGKNSTPWAPGSLHDFMHAKVTIADDVVFCGSFNLSRSGERNAEDMLEIHDAALAEKLADLRRRRPRALPALHDLGKLDRLDAGVPPCRNREPTVLRRQRLPQALRERGKERVRGGEVLAELPRAIA